MTLPTRAGLLAVLAAAVLVAAGASPGRGAAPSTTVVTLTEGTNVAATVSPDGRTIVMELQGVLWSLPSAGGVARQLTDGLQEPARPDWSPRGDLIAFQAYAGGTFHIWVMNPDGSGVRQLTSGHGDDREPRFSHDGSRVAFASDRAFEGSYDIWVVEVATGALQRRTAGAHDEFEPAWSPGDAEIAFVDGVGATGTTIQAVKADGTIRALARAAPGTRVNSPSWSPDGASIAYAQFASNRSRLVVAAVPAPGGAAPVGTEVPIPAALDDVFPFPAVWLSATDVLYTSNGRIRVSSVATGSTGDVPFQAAVTLSRPAYDRKRFDLDSTRRRPVKGIVGPALSPDGSRVVFQALNQIWLLDIGGQARPLTADAYYKEDPAWSPDGKHIAFSSDKAGTEDLYVLDLETGQERRVTSLPGAEVSAAWSPDGTRLAFQDETGATLVVDLASGAVAAVGTPPAGQSKLSLFAPSKPSWSRSGATIAIGALKPYTRRFREGTTRILTVDVASGALTYTEPGPFMSLSTRGEDGPVYSPDGTAMAYVMESNLWVRPVDARGVPVGTATRITGEVTDAPTWSGDSRRLLYLSSGRLRLVPREGGEPVTVPVDLSWRAERAEGRTLIHAGRLWDGTGPSSATDVDVAVVDGRIRSIEPHRDGLHRGAFEHNDRFVDASGLTVIPGLWESHTHEWISGKFYGDRLGRLWLAYGVTSLNSVGDPVYRAAETRESFGSGSRVGPRYFATGEAIDGERVYYNFMRPTTSEAQLARELERARDMDYDMVKTYVRLPHAWQAEAVRFAHEEMGVWVASHYMLPGMGFGVDGMTHVSATTRLGFAATRSSAGVSYGDVRSLFARSGMFDISTTFNPSQYADDPGMVDDPRLQVLNTPWDEAALRLKRDRAVSTDQTVSLDSLRKEEQTFAAILHGGGTMLAGTDSPLDNVATALHLNLRGQVKYGGLAPWEALQTATLLPARTFGVIDDLGTVEPGKLADLAFVEGNPLEDVKAAAAVRMVMKGGRLYTVPELMAPFQPGAGALADPAPARMAPPPAAAGADAPWWHDPAEMVEDEHR